MNAEGIIDGHTHIFTDEAYRSYLEKSPGAVDKIITIQYWTGARAPKYSLGQLVSFAKDKKLSVMAAVNPRFPIAPQLANIASFGDAIIGVKMYPGYEPFYPYDTVVDEVAEFCTAHNKPLMFHSGSTSSRGEPLLKFAHPIHIDELATRHRQCMIIIAHFGFPFLMEAGEIINKHPNVYADISGTIEKPSSEAALNRAVRRYTDDLRRVLDYYPGVGEKMLYGTDFGGDHTHLNQVAAYDKVVAHLFAEDEADAEYAVCRGAAQKLFFGQ